MQYFDIIINFVNADIKVIRRVHIDNLKTILSGYNLTIIEEIKLLPYIL